MLLDGEDVRRYTLRDLRRQIALVSQDVVLFDDTIANNIAYGALAQAVARRHRARGGSGVRHGVRRGAAAGPRHARRRARRAALGRPAAAHRDRARAAEGCARADSRRGDVGARHRIRAPHSGRADSTHARSHDARHRASSVDHRARRSHRRRCATARSWRPARTPSCSRAAVTTLRCTRCSSPSEPQCRPPAETARIVSGTATARCAGAVAGLVRLSRAGAAAANGLSARLASRPSKRRSR